MSTDSRIGGGVVISICTLNLRNSIARIIRKLPALGNWYQRYAFSNFQHVFCLLLHPFHCHTHSTVCLQKYFLSK